jgi:ribosome biogenesis GTPase
VRSPGAERVVQLAGQRVAVGDEVTIGLSEDRETWQLVTIGERRTKLSRPDVGNANLERVVVANVDVVCLVVAVVAPPLHPRIIDRYLIAIEKGGAAPILCVNKVDLLDERSGDELAKLDPYRALNVPIYSCSTKTGDGIEDVRAALHGKTAAFVGHSGVGKSSLMNALYPGLDLDTGAVSEGYGRGTHTTSASSLHDFPGGTRLIDTPGIRSFGIGKLTPQELQWHFPEFEQVNCKFRDCSHDHEPNCGVREAARSGAIHPARYDTYLRLLKGD